LRPSRRWDLILLCFLERLDKRTMLLLTLKAGANRYAIDVVRVIELVPRVELRVIPHAPPFLAGLLGYRGKVIPVIDLGLLLNGVACLDRLSTRVIVVNDSPGDQARGTAPRGWSDENPSHSPKDPVQNVSLLGLIGEEVSDLVDVQSDQVAPAPIQLAQTPFLGAIAKTDVGIVQLIAVERIRESSLSGHLLDQGQAWNADPSNAETGLKALEDVKAND
jgi:chemotaxis-related protein WspB